MKQTFSQRCYAILKKVPKGKVTTYKAIANALGTKAYQAVGNAMNRNCYRDVPCHRVVKSNGEIGGFARGTRRKIKLLEKEELEIADERIDLKKYLHKFKYNIFLL